jgi:hypothetical protein
MPNRSLAWRAPSTIIVMVASGLFFLLGLRTFFFPEAAARFFGAPSSSAEAMVFVKAYGARNIAISLMAAALIWLDLRLALAILLALAALVAGLDAASMFAFSGWPGAAKHVAYVLALGALAATVGSHSARRRAEIAR